MTEFDPKRTFFDLKFYLTFIFKQKNVRSLIARKVHYPGSEFGEKLLTQKKREAISRIVRGSSSKWISLTVAHPKTKVDVGKEFLQVRGNGACKVGNELNISCGLIISGVGNETRLIT